MSLEEKKFKYFYRRHFIIDFSHKTPSFIVLYNCRIDFCYHYLNTESIKMSIFPISFFVLILVGFILQYRTRIVTLQ